MINNTSRDIYDAIDQFICQEMNSVEEEQFLEKISEDIELQDRTLLNTILIKAIRVKGKKTDSELFDIISEIQTKEHTQ